MTEYDMRAKALKEAVISCKVPDILKAVEEARAEGMPAVPIIEAMSEAMGEVGVLFERGRIFLPHVLSAAAGMNKTMEILGPELKANSTGESANAVVVIGTVEGDVHDIGKSICSTMLQCGGFEIHDLGRDVPKQQFIDEIKNGAKFCGMSALMTSTMMVMKDTIDVLKEQNLRDQVVVMVGGAPITQVFSDKIGADIYGESASETTEKAKAWLNKQ